MIIFTQELMTLVLPFTIMVGSLILGYTLRGIIFYRLTKWAQNTKSPVDDIIVAAIREPFIIWCLMGGIYFALEVSQLSPHIVQIAEKALLALGILSVTLATASVSTKLVDLYTPAIETALPVTSLTQNIARIFIFIVGGLTILHNLGVSITPLLASLGVGGLAVALALQDTLSNFFSGFHIIVSRQIKVGDYVKLGSGEEGYITDINWRTTKIRALPNNIVLVPNAKLTQAIITNYDQPDKEIAVLINLGVHYNSDLKEVERITCEVAKEVMQKVQGGVSDFEPFIRYNAFADFSINFTVILRAKEFVDQYLIKHEFIKSLHERYKKEGITIPYPIRAINDSQEKSELVGPR